jgi:hypothetical protein
LFGKCSSRLFNGEDQKNMKTAKLMKTAKAAKKG